MTNTNELKTNDSGYICFKSRNWGYRGDRGTWARLNKDGSITLKISANGLLSDAYTNELRDFCAQHGQDFDSIGFGNSITFTK